MATNRESGEKGVLMDDFVGKWSVVGGFTGRRSEEGVTIPPSSTRTSMG